MLTLIDRIANAANSKSCSANLTRRQMLTIGGLGLGGLTLPDLLAGNAQANDLPAAVSGKSVIFLFQQGGPSQLETFDPKPEAPSGSRTVTGVIPTALPGVQFGSTMERLASLADKLTVVRSFQTGNGGHNIQPIVGPDSLETNIGVHYSRVVGTTRPLTGVPTNAVLQPAAVNPKVPGPSARGDLRATGSYGKGYVPFTPGADGQFQQDMQVNLPHDRLSDRRSLLSELDRLRREADAGGQFAAQSDLRDQAYNLLLGGGVSNALDLSQEDPSVVAQYDTSHFAKGKAWNHVSRGRSGYYNAQAQTIGKLLLMARRLCEAGCGFVTIHAGYAGVWDMHADGNNLNMTDGMRAVGYSFDHAVASFVEDLEARGLSDQILLVCCGEMGRTPKINARGGRDHWAKLSPLLLYGGGMPKGQVIGQSDRMGGEPQGEAYTPKNLISTILHTVFNVGQLRLVPSVPQQILQLAQQPPIHGTIA